MDLIITAIINTFIWVCVITFLIRGKSVIYEMRAGSIKVVVILFFGLGLLQYLSHRNLYSLITFISITIAGIIYLLIPSGIGKNEFIILGRVYPYNKVKYLELAEENNVLQLKFEYKRRTYFLFADKDKEDEVRKIVKKYYRR